MKNNFQIIMIVVFIAAAVFGVFVFSGAIPLGDDGSSRGQGTVVLWGTANTGAMGPLLEEFNQNNDSFVIQYIEKNPNTFDQELLEALAEGRGPDIFLLPDDLAFHYARKIFTVPFESYPLASFKENFVGAGEVFLTDRGIMAFPISVDPMLLYYNRHMLDAAGIGKPPADWDSFVEMTEKLTQKNVAGELIKSGAALGQFGNVAHAKDILTTLFMQYGNPITIFRNGFLVSSLSDHPVSGNLPSRLRFYNQFSDPLAPVYSWNRSFPNSLEAFSSEDTAFYFGYASEIRGLVGRNPNQNFFIAPMPQVAGANFKLTSAQVLGIAISAASKNFNTAFIAANQLSSGAFAQKFATTFGIAPARRDALVGDRSDAFSPIIFSSALFARTFLDPSPEDTDDIFRTMIEGALSGGLSLDQAIVDASAKLNLLLARQGI